MSSENLIIKAIIVTTKTSKINILIIYSIDICALIIFNLCETYNKLVGYLSKGISTWIWVMGGILISFIVFSIYLKIFSDLVAEKHRQDSLESLDIIASDVNFVFESHTLDSVTKLVSFSNFVESVYASDDGEDYTVDYVSYGNNICIKFMEDVECRHVNSKVQVISYLEQKSLFFLLNKITGNFGYRDYVVKIGGTDGDINVNYW